MSSGQDSVGGPGDDAEQVAAGAAVAESVEEGSWRTAVGSYPFSTEERCDSEGSVACSPAYQAAPAGSAVDRVSDSVLGGIGAVFASDFTTVEYRGSVIARRQGSDPANPEELMLITVLDLTNNGVGDLQIRGGVPEFLDINARFGAFSNSHEGWMARCGASGVPYNGMIEQGETVTMEFCWQQSAPNGWMLGDPYVRAEGPGSEMVWLAGLVDDYPEELRDEVQSTIVLMSERVDRDPAENGLTDWERRHRLGG